MCRLSAYKGKSILIGDLVSRPDNSLILQSRDAAYHPGVVDKTHRRNILVNGDGFGVAWYGANAMKGSCCFKFLTPAWSNTNLRSIGEHIASPLILAHVRAASSGHDPNERVVVSIENCHPFKFEQLTFMHNGGIPQFSLVKLSLLNLLDARFFREIKGNTDSEHLFALFLTFLFQNRSKNASFVKFTLDEIVSSVNLTISAILSLCSEAQIEDACSVNIVVSDGVHMVATRFRNGPQHPPSLYYNFGADFVCDDEGHFYSSGDTKQVADSIVISSAPLSKVYAVPSSVEGCNTETGCRHRKEDIGHWVLMPKDHMLIVRGDEVQPEKVLSISVVPVEVSHPDLSALRPKKIINDRPDAKSSGLSNPPVPAKIIRFRSKL